jgi:hypothetical protein
MAQFLESIKISTSGAAYDVGDEQRISAGERCRADRRPAGRGHPHRGPDQGLSDTGRLAELLAREVEGVIYPVVIAFAVVFLAIGLRNFRRRVLS